MEYVSVLAGEAFSDGPQCTHPALAALARMVNDRIVGDGVRNQLVLLAPNMIGMPADDPRITERVVASCLLTAATATAGRLPRAARRRLDRAAVRLRRLNGSGPRQARWALWRERLFTPPNMMVHAAFQVLAFRVGGMPHEQQDALFADLLRDVVADCGDLPDRRTRAAAPARQ